jgi:hypothetical protein
LKTNHQSFRYLFLLLFALMGYSLTVKAQNAWINEIHYNNIGADTNEIVEVVIENPSYYALSSFSIVLYNGAPSIRTPYDTKTLNLYTAGNSIGNFTFYYYSYPTDGIQNGAPDGMALVYGGTVVSGQFLSYEGAFVAASGPAIGLTSTNIGVSESGTTPVGHSLQLSGTGFQYSHFIWQNPATATAGAINNNQTIIENPNDFDASTFSQTQINLLWTPNSNNNNVIVAWNTSDTFGTPSGTYIAGDQVSGGGTVLYNGSLTSFSHNSLTAGNNYYYKAWSVDGSNTYSSGTEDSATTQFPEPTNNPSGLAATSNGTNYITVSWTDSDAAHYLVKGSNTGFSSIATPVDGVAESDAALVKNVSSSIQQHQFTGLMPNTLYCFKIFPYNITGEVNNYKTDGTVPQASATTDVPDMNLIISEVADPVDSTDAKFVEIINIGTTSIDFSNLPVYLCLQADGNTWSSVQLTGTMSPGEAYVVSYQTTRFLSAYGFPAEQNSMAISGNGDDGYYLYYGGDQNSGYLMDAFGVINEDGTGKTWEYLDKKAVRKRNIASPNATWTASEWVILPASAKATDMTPGFHKGDVIWQGIMSADWNNRSNNWSSPNGYIPDASCNVTIPDVTVYPVITGPSACHEVQIQSGSALSIQSTGSLLVVGP